MMEEQRQYRTVTLRLWDAPIQLSYNFVRSTKLNDVFKRESDISNIFTSDMSDKASLVRELLHFFSDCYEDVIDNRVETLLGLILFKEREYETKQLTFTQIAIILNDITYNEIIVTFDDITTFFMLYENIFISEDKVIFETYKELKLFVKTLKDWINISFMLIKLERNVQTRLHTEITNLYGYLDNILINAKQFYLSGGRKTQRMTQALRSYKSPNETVRRGYESMRKRL